MAEKMQTDDVLSRQAVFVRYCLYYSNVFQRNCQGKIGKKGQYRDRKTCENAVFLMRTLHFSSVYAIIRC